MTTAAVAVLWAAAAATWIPSRVDRIRRRRRAALAAQIAEERDLADAMWQANVDGFERLGRSANR